MCCGGEWSCAVGEGWSCVVEGRWSCVVEGKWLCVDEGVGGHVLMRGLVVMRC